MKHLAATGSALALAVGQAAFAQEGFDLGEITVFANKSGEATELERSGVSVEIVTGEELQQAGETKIADILARLPGVSVSANGGLGANTTLRVRGLDGKYIKVLIDGIDVTDPSSTQTQFNWGNLTAAGIGRIELLKGASSSVYGSRAIAGVVNITTAKRPETPGREITLTAEAGSFGTYRAGAAIATTTERGGFTFALNRVESDGFSARDGAANTEPDGFESTQLNFAGDFQATDTLRLGLSGYYLDAEGDFDEFGGDGTPPFDEFTRTETRALRGFAEWQTGAVENRFSATYYRNDRLSSSNGFDTVFDGRRRKFDYTGVYAASDTASLSFGADWEREEFVSGGDSGRIDTRGLFGEALFSPATGLDLAASLRYDDNSAFGGNLSGRLAAAVAINDATTLRAVAATGFRAPSLYELNNTFYGNPALQPETSAGFELGIERRFGSASFVKATGFYTEIDDLIQFVTLSFSPFTGQYQQIAGTSVSKGIEVSGQWALTGGFSLIGSYTYTDATDASGAPLLRVPGDDLVLGAEAAFNSRLSANLTVNHVADRPAEFGTAMPDYTVVNAALSYALTDQTEAYLRIENLFDEQYQTANGFSAADRALFVGLRAAF